MYVALDQTSVTAYVRQSPLWASLFDQAEDLEGEDLADGNINLVFRVYCRSDRSRSAIIKQALPWSRRYPEIILPLDRIRIEHDAMQVQSRYCAECVPRIYHYDPEMYLIVMEDLNHHVVMRFGLMEQTIYPCFAAHIGRFAARTLFHTSGFFLDASEKKTMVARFINPAMCRITEDLVFTQPWSEHSRNRNNPLIAREAARLRSDGELCAEVLRLKNCFMCHAEALIHGDLHTGSIMVNREETKVFDSEFAFYGPMGFDIGAILANLLLSYASQEWFAPDPVLRARYREWLLAAMAAVWNVFEAEFCRLWEEDGNAEWPSPLFRRRFLGNLLRDSAGYAGCKIVRRILGLAHVPDLEAIPDLEARASAERLALGIAREWLMNSRKFATVSDMLELVGTAEAAPHC